MRIHLRNAGTLYPLGGRLTTSCRDSEGRPAYICRVAIIEGEDGLTVIDTGFGTKDASESNQRLGKFFIRTVGPALRHEETLISHIGELGYQASDVKRILLTHLDLDHTGGLSDFPDALVYASNTAIEAALNLSHPLISDPASESASTGRSYCSEFAP